MNYWYVSYTIRKKEKQVCRDIRKEEMNDVSAGGPWIHV